MSEWKPDICIYHGGCDDGFGSAWVVRKKWGSSIDGSGDYAARIDYVPMGYGGTLPDIKGLNVLMVDFSLKRDAMIEAADLAKSIVVLDHHKTAEAELAQWNIGPVRSFSGELIADHIAQAVIEQSLPIVAHFDMEHSGARMAWDFCFPGEPVPSLIEHIEDRDLWRFRLITTPAVSAALRTYEHDFRLWDELDVPSLIGEGTVVLRGHHKNITAFIQHRYWRDVGGYRVPVVNVPYHYASDCADAMLKAEPDAPFAASYFDIGDGRRQWSLRSRNDRVDVSEVATAKGGGGHRNAAGFMETA